MHHIHFFFERHTIYVAQYSFSSYYFDIVGSPAKNKNAIFSTFMDNQKATAAEQYDTTYSLDFANTIDPVFNRASKYRYFNVNINFGVQSRSVLVKRVSY